MNNLEQFIRGIPKAELHVHFAGTLHFDTIQRLVSKYDVSGVDIDALYYRGDTYMNVLPALKVACDLLREAAENGIRYREMFWNPTDHEDIAGVSYSIAQDAIITGLNAAEQDFGIIGRLIPSIDREKSPERAVELVEEVLANPKDETLGIGMDYLEERGAPENFLEAYRIAGEGGLKRTAHAGEDESPPRNIKICLDLLKCDRIDHGYTVLNDEMLLSECIERGVLFTVVPTNSHYSEILAGQDWSEVHPIRHMLDQGLRITIGSDDPPLHHTDPGWSYMIVLNEMGFTLDDVRQLIINSIDASWASENEKRKWREEWLTVFDEERNNLLV
ncbi:MAG: adenosine deaminase family protein [Candidatus Thorarchaeota archaeon]|jgi:adenosine deaminase